MSKYIKVFDTVEQYNAYSGGTAFTSPNISYIKSTDETKYDDNEIKHYSEDGDSWIITEEIGSAITHCVDTIKSVKIPNTVEVLGSECFSNFDYLESVEIPSSVTTIGEKCFYGCIRLKTVNYPNISYIPNYCFNICYKLDYFDLPSTITTIGNYAFDVCTGFTDVTIHSGVTSIGAYAYSRCGSLSSVTLSEGLESIGERAFGFDYNLTELTIPSTVTSIGALILYDENYSKTITVLATTPPNLSGKLVHSVWNNRQTIYVPDESVEAYKSATNWSLYKNSIKPISEKPNN